MDEQEIKYFIEAALLAAGRPLSVDQLHGLFDGRSAPAKAEIRKSLESLREDYEGRGIAISEVASGFRIQVTASMAERLQKLWEERPPRYSRALFETLSLVAYRQPITRGEIEEVRGVSVTPNIVRTLLERDWIRVIGHRDVPGRPEMFGTTRNFLDYFGLKKLDDLPALADLSDWESLRVQLNLPEVEEGETTETDVVGDVPVLYPEIDAEDGEAGEAESSDPSPAEPSADEEKLVVSEWPDPLSPRPVASLEVSEENDDKDVSANQ
jgi:segregation and condensation protein B